MPSPKRAWERIGEEGEWLEENARASFVFSFVGTFRARASEQQCTITTNDQIPVEKVFDLLDILQSSTSKNFYKYLTRCNERSSAKTRPTMMVIHVVDEVIDD